VLAHVRGDLRRQRADGEGLGDRVHLVSSFGGGGTGETGDEDGM
jgi:hypothetical protein